MNVFLSNAPQLGNNHCVLMATNGPGDVWIYDPTCCDYVVKRVPPLSCGGVVFNADDCHINDVPHQTIPDNLEFLVYLKLKPDGCTFYLNALPMFNASRTTPILNNFYDFVDSGIPTDVGTKHGTLVGMIWRDPYYDLQGQANSEFVSSYWQPGRYSFIANPTGSAGPGTWTTCAGQIEMLMFGRYAPWVGADFNFTCTVPGAAMNGRIIMNGALTSSPCACYSPPIPGYPQYGGATLPMINFIDGLKRFEVQIFTNAGTVTLGAATNSLLHVQAQF